MWRIREYHNGKTYRITVHQNTKPTQKQAMALLQAQFDTLPYATIDPSLTFGEACQLYNEIKKPVLSPSTIKDYTSLAQRYSVRLCEAHLCDLTSTMVQIEVNEYIRANKPSAKTVKNFYGYIVAVCKQFNPSFKPFRVDLPRAEQKEVYIPSTEDIKAIVRASEGTVYETGIKLACYGLRRSELLAVTADDLEDDNTLHINKAMVQDETKQWIVKPYGKTDDSTRDIIISQDLADLIRQQGKVVNYHPGNILRHLKRTQTRLGIEHFTLHKFRHWSCSELHHKGMTEADLMKYFGWSKRSDVMKIIYRHDKISRDVEQRKLFCDTLTSALL